MDPRDPGKVLTAPTVTVGLQPPGKSVAHHWWYLPLPQGSELQDSAPCRLVCSKTVASEFTNGPKRVRHSSGLWWRGGWKGCQKKWILQTEGRGREGEGISHSPVSCLTTDLCICPVCLLPGPFTGLFPYPLLHWL
jgi:hypothetical protein